MPATESHVRRHVRTHDSLARLIDHCRGFEPGLIDRELDGFGYPSIRLQLHHVLGAERYWIAALQGRLDADDDADSFVTLDAIEDLRATECKKTLTYLRTVDGERFEAPLAMKTWRGEDVSHVPADVLTRVQMHAFQHQGQVTAMCRLLGRPAEGLDYRID